MAQAVPKTRGPRSKERTSTEVDIPACGDSHPKGTALTSAKAERHSVRASRSLAQDPPGWKSLATTDNRLVAALDKALAAISPPAFVITSDGKILRSNGPARLLLAHEREAVDRSLARALSHRAADTAWDLEPLGNAGDPAGFLAICRSPWRAKSNTQSLRKARRAWKLTARQTEVLDLVARGMTNDLIAEELAIGKGTVEFHLSAIFDRAGVSNRTTLIVQMLALR